MDASRDANKNAHMTLSREALLQPTLSENSPTAAPYSIQATFFTGFFGGPLAALAILALSSLRLRRLARDALVYLALLLLTVVGSWALYKTAAGAAVRDWLGAHLGTSYLRYTFRFVALIIVGLGYLLHRREHRNADLVGLARPNGWIAGIFCIFLGILFHVGLLFLIDRA